MRIDPAEFRARSLRVHALLHGVTLEDVWAIRLPGGGAGRTIQDVRTVFIAAVVLPVNRDVLLSSLCAN